jgi:hypothetical protein
MNSPEKSKGRQTAWSGTLANHLLSVLFLIFFPSIPLAQAQQLRWLPQGASPNLKGQVENIDGEEVTGAIQALSVHPTDPNTVYVGAVNGGIWKSVNAMASPPVWKQLTDAEDSLSIGAIEFDPTDATHQTVVAGVGKFSSLAGTGGSRSGLLQTKDGGITWTQISSLRGLNISGVAPRGQTIVVAANAADDPTKVGIWRTTGGPWTKISGSPGTGLPNGACSSLASDPSSPTRLYANAWRSGIFRSDNAGSTWSKVSSPEMAATIGQADNVKISVGASGQVYVAIDVGGHLAAVFHSPDGTNGWSGMGLPGMDEGGIHPGGQGGIHLAIAADPTNSNIVYIGGDRQPAKFVNGVETGQSSDDPPQWPNSIGAFDYTGRLFRGDYSKAIGSQWFHLTHSKNLGPQGGGTPSSSAPHADSRGLQIAPNGTLISVNDGGIYGRSQPLTNNGDWFSMNGNLQVAEFHSVAWDSNTHTIVAGAQDTGSPEQQVRSDVKWESVSTGDGGVVAVDTSSSPGQSVRYTSYYDLGAFRRQIYDSSNVLQREDYPALTLLNGSSTLQPQFYTPIKLNTVNPTRMIIGANNSVYESLDQGDTITEIGPGIVTNPSDDDPVASAIPGVNPIAYGASDNPDMLYVGSKSLVYIRHKADPARLAPSSSYNGGYVVGIAMDPNHADVAFVASPTHVYQTTNGGDAWKDISGNLPPNNSGNLRSITYSTITAAGILIVGMDKGVYEAKGPAFSNWSQMGIGLPNAPVYHVEYSPTDQLLLVGTLGRGAWTLRLPGSSTVSAHAYPRPRLRAAALVTADATQVPADPPPQVESSQARFQLAPGVVVDPAHNQIYTMDVAGGVKAVDAKTGRLVWKSPAAAKPLGLSDSHLIVQLESGKEQTLNLGSLDTRTGQSIASASAPLPSHVVPSIDPNSKGNFSAIANNLPNGDAVVSWQYVQRTPRALPPGTKSNLPSEEGAPPPPAASEQQATRGAVRFDPRTGALGEVEAENLASVPSSQTNLSEMPGTAEGRRFLSVDGQDYLVSSRLDPSEANKYTLTVYDRQTNARLGQFKSSVAAVPFYVTDSKVIFEISASVSRTSSGLTKQPRRIEGVDLATGKEIWSTPIRDTTYRGPFPP